MDKKQKHIIKIGTIFDERLNEIRYILYRGDDCRVDSAHAGDLVQYLIGYLASSKQLTLKQLEDN